MQGRIRFVNNMDGYGYLEFINMGGCLRMISNARVTLMIRKRTLIYLMIFAQKMLLDVKNYGNRKMEIFMLYSQK